jgi:beta-N-acetylhexosaminidase
VIVSDALEMRATREMFGIPGAAVLAVVAGTDLLCLGRDGSEDDYLAVRDALVAAVRDGTLDGERLEEAADRVARLRGGLARARSAAPAGAGASSDSAGPAGAGTTGAGPAGAGPVGVGLGPAVGLVAARRAVQVSGPRRTLSHPVIIEVEPRENIAAGRFGWGLGPWAPADSVHRVSASGRLLNGAGLGPADDAASAAGPGPVDAAGILAAAAGRSLVAVVRDAHRDEQTRSLVSALLATRPDLILVEMGLPFWRPPEGTSYLATYGASRASAHAAAELLGLAPA